MFNSQKNKIREFLNHGTGDRKVRITKEGEVHIKGTTGGVDRSKDFWAYYGDAAEILLDINRQEQDCD